MKIAKTFQKTLLPLALLIACAFSSQNAAAVTISTINNPAGIGDTLAGALLATNSGINIVAGSTIYQGVNNASIAQSAQYSNFNLAPSSGSSPTLSLGNGILLTTGNASLPLTNTDSTFTGVNNGAGNAQLQALSNTVTYDANVLGFSFTVAEGVNSISAQFVFGTDEFNEQVVTDIFGFFVDGVNYAYFPNGQLISNNPGSSNFIDNTGGAYGIEYDGLTNVLTVTGLLDSSLTTHTFMVGIADTSDDIIDSGVFITSLAAGTSNSGGIEDPADVPEPASLGLVGLGLAALAALKRAPRRRR